MAREYRKKVGSDAWHWCTNCNNWPTGAPGVDYISNDGKPDSGELDNECRSKEKAGTCSA